MSAVVQATCPGCRNVLRIPADWVKTAIRCKHCQTVLMPRQPAPDKTPVPAKKKGPPPLPAAVMPATPALPPPVAEPVAQLTPTKKKKANAFADIDDEPATERVRRRRPRGGVLAPLIVMALMLLGGGGAVAYFWADIKAALNGEQLPSTAQNEDKPGKTGEPKDKNPSPSPKDSTSPARDGTLPKDGTPGKDRTGPKDRSQPKESPTPTGGFPRRALMVSTHNYLYANLVHSGPPTGQRNMPSMVNTLARGLRIPLTQIAHLSDEAGRGMKRPPLKPVVEKTITDFLAGSRAQDRILLFLVGHVAEIEDKLYYVPIEGDMETVDGLIPLTWVMEELAKCPARQKILVADLNRENPAYGRERPGSGPMSEKLEAFLKAPPEGVQVLSACSKDGYSYETDDSPMGVFLDSLGAALEKGFQGNIQRASDLILVEKLTEMVNAEMKRDLDGRNFKQVAFFAGKDRDNESTYDPKEPLAKEPVLATSPNVVSAETATMVKAILNEIDVPPVKVTKANNKPDYASLITAANLADYGTGGEATPIREKIKQVRALLWGVAGSTDSPLPAELKDLAEKHRAELKVDLNVLRDGYGIPANESTFKVQVENDGKNVAKILFVLEEAQGELKDMADMKEKESKRWQANYDFILAHLEAQIAYLYEYQSMLGQIRKELPEHDKTKHSRFALASRSELTGDSTGKKMAKSSNKILTALADETKGTPWEIIAKREKMTSLGLEWKATSSR